MTGGDIYLNILLPKIFMIRAGWITMSIFFANIFTHGIFYSDYKPFKSVLGGLHCLMCVNRTNCNRANFERKVAVSPVLLVIEPREFHLLQHAGVNVYKPRCIVSVNTGSNRPANLFKLNPE